MYVYLQNMYHIFSPQKLNKSLLFEIMSRAGSLLGICRHQKLIRSSNSGQTLFNIHTQHTLPFIYAQLQRVLAWFRYFFLKKPQQYAGIKLLSTTYPILQRDINSCAFVKIIYIIYKHYILNSSSYSKSHTYLITRTPCTTYIVSEVH